MRTLLQSRSRAGRRAFTLVELMTAMAVAGLLVGALAAAARQALVAWQEATSRAAQRRQADGVLDMLARDVESALFRRDGSVWLAATLQRSPQPARGDGGVVDADWSGRVKPPDGIAGAPGSSLHLYPESGDLSEYRFGQAGLWLRLFTVPPDSNDRLSNHSAPRAVAYQLIRRRVTGAATSSGGAEAPLRYVLYRSTARPFGPTWPETNSTFASGYDLFRSGVAPDYNEGDASRIDQVGNLRTPRRFEQVLAQHVIDFGVRVWVRDETGRRVIAFPARDARGRDRRGFAGTVRDGRGSRPAAVPSGWAELGGSGDDLAYGVPERMDLCLRLLTEEGARVIEAFERGRVRGAPGEREDETWWALARRHSTVFTRTVFLHGRGVE
ncbi:MAG: prepilin-type N-terminal cleavage/methylation domain-containing protein [Opitutaceae bacterium]|nr:prepilin-type N-terminal cleavage/methylation domain-containing protein [Opitutaceae bacterium]